MIFHHSGILPCFCEGGIFLSAGDQALNLGNAFETKKDIFVYVRQCTVTKKREGLRGPSDEVDYHMFCVYCNLITVLANYQIKLMKWRTYYELKFSFLVNKCSGRSEIQDFWLNMSTKLHRTAMADSIHWQFFGINSFFPISRKSTGNETPLDDESSMEDIPSAL